MSLAALLGTAVGSVLGIYVLAMLWEWALFKRVMDSPVSGKVCATLAAWVTAGVIWSFGTYMPAYRVSGVFQGLYLYAFGAIVVGGMGIFRGRKLEREQEAIDYADGPDLAETFN